MESKEIRKFTISVKLIMLLLVILIFQVTGSCAAQNKYSKHRAVPCPCVSNFRR